MAKKKASARRNNQGDNLSHEEIWDDSALVRSWDEAVEEYNFYHSIHARGENVDDVLARAERDGVEAVAADIHKVQDAMDIENKSGNAAIPTEEKQDITSKADAHRDQAGSSSASGALPSTTGVGPSVPDALLGQVQDPALKSLMMAWYFAGYYTGLYEGQQQGSRNEIF